MAVLLHVKANLIPKAPTREHNVTKRNDQNNKTIKTIISWLHQYENDRWLKMLALKCTFSTLGLFILWCPRNRLPSRYSYGFRKATREWSFPIKASVLCLWNRNKKSSHMCTSTKHAKPYIRCFSPLIMKEKSPNVVCMNNKINFLELQHTTYILYVLNVLQ